MVLRLNTNYSIMFINVLIHRNVLDNDLYKSLSYNREDKSPEGKESSCRDNKASIKNLLYALRGGRCGIYFQNLFSLHLDYYWTMNAHPISMWITLSKQWT